VPGEPSKPRLSPGSGHEQFRGDDGSADPVVRQALDAYAEGQGSEYAALRALAASRLLVPVVAVLNETDETGTREKSSEMALPTLIGADGRPAIIAFTSAETLARWRPDARPMPAEADRVWQAAVAEKAAVVIDLAGPVQLVVEGARLEALASGEPPPVPYEDPDIHALIAEIIAGYPAITGVRIGPGSTEFAANLSIELLVTADTDWEPQVRGAAEAISARLWLRGSHGTEITAMGA
jgi:hypothetical protein